MFSPRRAPATAAAAAVARSASDSGMQLELGMLYIIEQVSGRRGVTYIHVGSSGAARGMLVP